MAANESYSPSMEITTDKSLAVLVHHYLMERCMANVADMFAENCVYMQSMVRSSHNPYVVSTPMESLRNVLQQRDLILLKLKRLIQRYHMEAPVPFEEAPWDKIECMMEYFYEKAKRKSSIIAFTTSSQNLNFDSRTTHYTAEYESENVIQMVDYVPQQPLPVQNENVTGCEASIQEADPTCSIVVQMENTENVPKLQTESMESVLTFTEDDVTIGQQIEISTRMVDTEHTPSASSANPPTVDDDAAQPPENVSANKENQVPIPVPHDGQPGTEQQTTMIECFIDLTKTMSSTTVAPEGTSTIVNVTTPTKKSPNVRRMPIDAKALEEWKRMRSINNRNFDDHIRQINHQLELMNCTEKPKKSSTAKASPKIKQRKTTRKPKKTAVRTAPAAQKQKVAKKQNEKTPSKRQPDTEANKCSALADIDTSDFATSSDEAQDVRGMVHRVKQYRKQQKHDEQKEKKPEESTSQSNVYTSPSSLPQCRVNVIVGRSPRISSTQRGLRNRTLSTSPVGTPMKLTKSEIVRSQLLQSGTKAKEPTVATAAHQKAKFGPEEQTVPAQSGPVALTPKNRRPVRACTVNRKMLVASTPLKQPAPSVANMVSELVTSDRQTSTSPKSAIKRKTNAETSPEANNTGTVDAGEAAIYAVLAQLHGDN